MDGVFYERLVGLVKRSLRKTIGRNLLTEIHMQTLVKEVESCVNSRPLVYVGDDINSTISLTPAHFLSLNQKTGKLDTYSDNEDEEYTPDKSSAQTLLEFWKKGKKLLNKFWSIWRNDYLLNIRERYQTNIKQNRIKSPHTASVGDIVLVKDEMPRGCWRLGKIIDLITSADGLIRSSKVCVSTGRVLCRPLSLLISIETSGDFDYTKPSQNVTSENLFSVTTRNI